MRLVASEHDSNFIVLRGAEITCKAREKFLRFEMRGLEEMRG